MPICNACHNEIPEEAFSFCPYCGHPVKRSDEPSTIVALARKRKRWYGDIGSLPSVIAHEYDRLHKLCEEDKPYGALLEIRDLYETLLKFEILVLCAFARHTEDNVFFETVGCEITRPKQSFGDWHNLGKRIAAYYNAKDEKPPRTLLNPLKTLLNRYESDNIINWRNERIGHGALGYGENDDFQAEIVRHIDRFKSIFECIGEYLKRQCLLLGDEKLQGPEKARNLSEHLPLSLMTVSDTAEEICFDITPFISLLSDKITCADTNSVFFYNNQNARIRASNMLSYPSGAQRTDKMGYFLEIEQLRVLREIKAETSTDIQGIITNQDALLLDKIWSDCMFYSYVDPDPLSTWLRNCINEAASGVFYLTMERGTGKSTFCESINSLKSEPYIISPDLDVRVLHMERSMIPDRSIFELSIENLWRQAYDGSFLVNLRPLSFYRAETASSWDALLLFLKQCQEIAESKRGKRRILMVIDGLDEITNESVWDFLPNEDGAVIPENVYILLTSRTLEDDGLPLDMKQHLKRIKPNKRYSWGRHTESYADFLLAYISSTPLNALSSEAKTKLMCASDYRVLLLGMLLKLVENGLAEENAYDMNSVAETYLSNLNSLYGEKESGKLRELLYIIGTFGESHPMKLQEIADLCWTEGTISIDLVSKIADLAPLLHLWHGVTDDRSMKGSSISFANPGLADFVLRRLRTEEQDWSYIQDQARAYIQDCLENKYIDGSDSYSWTVLRVIQKHLGSNGYSNESVLRYLEYLKPWRSQDNSKTMTEILSGMLANEPADVREKRRIQLALAETRYTLHYYEEARDIEIGVIRSIGEAEDDDVPFLFCVEIALIHTLLMVVVPQKEIMPYLRHTKDLIDKRKECFSARELAAARAEWHICSMEVSAYAQNLDGINSRPRSLRSKSNYTADYLAVMEDVPSLQADKTADAHIAFAGLLQSVSNRQNRHSVRKKYARLSEQQYRIAGRILSAGHEKDNHWHQEKRDAINTKLDSLALVTGNAKRKTSPSALNSKDTDQSRLMSDPDYCFDLALLQKKKNAAELLGRAVELYLEQLEIGRLSKPWQYTRIVMAISILDRPSLPMSERQLHDIILEAAQYQSNLVCSLDVMHAPDLPEYSKPWEWFVQARKTERKMKRSGHAAAADLIHSQLKTCLHRFLLENRFGVRYLARVFFYLSMTILVFGPFALLAWLSHMFFLNVTDYSGIGLFCALAIITPVSNLIRAVSAGSLIHLNRTDVAWSRKKRNLITLFSVLSNHNLLWAIITCLSSFFLSYFLCCSMGLPKDTPVFYTVLFILVLMVLVILLVLEERVGYLEIKAIAEIDFESAQERTGPGK